jgi:hypothetical protein
MLLHPAQPILTNAIAQCYELLLHVGTFAYIISFTVYSAL